MKKNTIIFVLLLLAGTINAYAQSGSAGKGQAGAGPVNNARKANTGQTQGKSVPYSKDQEQQQGRSQAKGGIPTTSGSATSSGSNPSGQGNNKSGKKSGTKSSGNGRNQ